LSAEGAWNYGGYGVNVVRRALVTVGQSMSSQRKALLAPEEYLALERRSEARSAYLAGEVFAMVGVSKRHNLIAANIISVLGNQPLERPCNVYPSDLRVKVSVTGKYTYTDVVVACEEERFEDAENDTLLNAVVIIEILSQSTEAKNRGRNFQHYQYIESLTEYILVAREPYRIEQYVRHGDREWRYSEYHDAEDVVRMDVFGCELALRDAYAKVE
jgi:Uma2 family endonuclease